MSEGAREKVEREGFATEIGVGRDVVTKAFWAPLTRALTGSYREFGHHSATLQSKD